MARRLEFPIGTRFTKLVVISESVGGYADHLRRYKVRCDCGNERFVTAKSLASGKTKSCGCLRVGKKIEVPIGTRFGQVVTISDTYSVNGASRVRIRCDCGNEKQMRTHDLRRVVGYHTCGECRKYTAEIGQRFGRLTVIGEVQNIARGRYKILVRCDCGNEAFTDFYHVVKGHTQSCGCIISEKTALRNIAGRSFDYAKAQELHDAGYTDKELTETLGVTGSNTIGQWRHLNNLAANARCKNCTQSFSLNGGGGHPCLCPDCSETLQWCSKCTRALPYEKFSEKNRYFCTQCSRKSDRIFKREQPYRKRAVGCLASAKARNAPIDPFLQTEEGKLAVMELQESAKKCFYCHDSLDSGYEIDHRVPITRGGRHELSNLAIVCKACNRLKNRRTNREYREYMATEMLARVQRIMEAA